MKAIIQGKRYDTDTATEVATYDNGLGISDFKQATEVLYRTPRGNWFMWGSGGADSPYARRCGDMWERNSAGKIAALTAQEAREWLERHRHVEQIEQYFASEIEDA